MPTVAGIIASLSPKQREAIAACHRAGVLTRSKGRWRGKPNDVAVHGGVVCDLTREGFMDSDHRPKGTGRATLTAKGDLVAVAIGNAVTDEHELGVHAS